MLAGMRRSRQRRQMAEDAAGSSTAQRTRSAVSRSVGRKRRSWWVTWLWAMRWATSGERPEVGQMTVTRAEALSERRMRPAATWGGC